MRDNKWGRVVNISSGASRSAFKRATPYNASKGGMNMLTVGLAVELGSYGITVNAVCPGAVMTGVETRTSSPLRILRGDDRQSVNVAGLYPMGEGAGYAGGIMSAALDGMNTARTIVSEYKPE